MNEFAKRDLRYVNAPGRRAIFQGTRKGGWKGVKKGGVNEVIQRPGRALYERIKALPIPINHQASQ